MRLSSSRNFSGVRVTRSLILYICFVDRCLSFCTLSSRHCVVCSSSIYGFWLPLWYLQSLLLLEIYSTNGLESTTTATTIIAFHKAVNQNSPVKIPDYVTQSTYSGTRSHSKAFIEIRANYEQYKNSFLSRTIKDWNALPTHLVHVTSVDEFGSRLQSLTT